MYQRDYILRMIEMMVEFIALVLARIRKGEFPDASGLIENAYRDFLKEDAAFFRGIPLDELTGVLLQKHHYSHGHLEILSQLFFAEGELNYAKGMMQESVEYYQKSRLLFEFVLRDSGIYSEEKEKHLEYLHQKIAALQAN